MSYIVIEGGTLMMHLRHPDPERFFVTFHLLRLAFILIALLVDYLRSSTNYYFPGLSELSTNGYWYPILGIVWSLKFMFMDRFLPISDLSKMVHLFLSLTVLITLLMAFQRQRWLRVPKRRLELELQRLAFRKARLTTEEFEAVRPYLLVEGVRRQRPPLIWRTVVWLGWVILGAILSAQAAALVDQLPVGLRNVLPPY